MISGSWRRHSREKYFWLIQRVWCLVFFLMFSGKATSEPASPIQPKHRSSAQATTVIFPGSIENKLDAFSLSVEPSFLSELTFFKELRSIKVYFYHKVPGESGADASQAHHNKIAIRLSSNKRKDEIFDHSLFRSQEWNFVGPKYGFDLYQGRCRSVDRQNNCVYPEVYIDKSPAGIRKVVMECGVLCSISSDFRGRSMTIRISRERLSSWEDRKFAAREFMESLVVPFHPANSIKLPFPALDASHKPFSLLLTGLEVQNVQFRKGNVHEVQFAESKHSTATDRYHDEVHNLFLNSSKLPRRFVRGFESKLRRSKVLEKIPGLVTGVFDSCSSKGSASRTATGCTPITEYYLKENTENDAWMAECKVKYYDECQVYGDFRGRQFRYTIKHEMLQNWMGLNNSVLKYLDSRKSK